MKTITLNDNHIAHLNAKNTTKLEYLNLSNNNLLPTNDIDQLISSKHLWHVLVNGINNDPLAQMQYWTAVRNIIDDTNEVTIDLSGLNLTTQPPGLQNFTSINLDNNQLTHFDATNYDRLVKLSLNSNALESIEPPGFPGECFICELRLPDHRFRWKHNKLFLLLPEEYGPAFPAIVDCYTSPPT